jgi:hypothetical protein
MNTQNTNTATFNEVKQPRLTPSFEDIVKYGIVLDLNSNRLDKDLFYTAEDLSNELGLNFNEVNNEMRKDFDNDKAYSTALKVFMKYFGEYTTLYQDGEEIELGS